VNIIRSLFGLPRRVPAPEGTPAFNKIAEGLDEAIAVARGEIPTWTLVDPVEFLTSPGCLQYPAIATPRVFKVAEGRMEQKKYAAVLAWPDMPGDLLNAVTGQALKSFGEIRSDCNLPVRRKDHEFRLHASSWSRPYVTHENGMPMQADLLEAGQTVRFRVALTPWVTGKPGAAYHGVSAVLKAVHFVGGPIRSLS
jgi:hypothetical protein